jgi:diphthamide synthase subunit DPH2
LQLGISARINHSHHCIQNQTADAMVHLNAFNVLKSLYSSVLLVGRHLPIGTHELWENNRTKIPQFKRKIPIMRQPTFESKSIKK